VLLSEGWKLQVAARPNKTWLFDLNKDPTEKQNLADAVPEKTAALKALLANVDAEQAKPLWPSLLEGPIVIDTPSSYPVKPSDEFIYWAN
jgi:hypothetical protein